MKNEPKNKHASKDVVISAFWHHPSMEETDLVLQTREHLPTNLREFPVKSPSVAVTVIIVIVVIIPYKALSKDFVTHEPWGYL